MFVSKIEKWYLKSFPMNGYVSIILNVLDNFCVPPLVTEVTQSVLKELIEEDIVRYSEKLPRNIVFLITWPRMSTTEITIHNYQKGCNRTVTYTNALMVYRHTVKLSGVTMVVTLCTLRCSREK
jgi:hypothetical protein